MPSSNEGILCYSEFMHHVAIMKKSWKLLPKILSGQKTIESRWYVHRVQPWDNVHAGDTVYFKNSGEPITVSAVVSNVMQFADLDHDRVAAILKKYGEADGISKEEVSEFYEQFKNKKYCILVFLKDVRSIKPFHIDKKGFGAMSAWISTPDIRKIRISN